MKDWNWPASRWTGSDPETMPVEAPNILFFLSDQQRADTLSVYGGRNIHTPNLDRLAAEGMRFEHALSPCPVCTPYRGMLMTGRYPTHSGIVVNNLEPDTRQRCLAHVFADAGYDTAYIGKWHLSGRKFKYAGKRERNNFAIAAYGRENPETEFTPPGPGRLGCRYWEAFNMHLEHIRSPFYRDSPERLHLEGFQTDGLTDLALDYLRRAPEPFLLILSPHPPHHPYRPDESPPGYLDRIGENLDWPPNVPEEHPRRRDPLEARCYLSMCLNMDDNVGRILDFLDSSGLADRTIVVFTSDHGDQNGSHGLIGKSRPFRESVDVPLIVRWPGHVPAGRVNESLFTPMDYLPTFCGMSDLDPPSSIDGLDLSRVLLKGEKADRHGVLMANYTAGTEFFFTGSPYMEWRAIHTGKHVYVRWIDGREELFDLREDPYQMNNLVATGIGLLGQLRQSLSSLLQTAHDEFLTGTELADWYDEGRTLLTTGLGPAAPGSD